MRVLVTGGSGFIASHCINTLLGRGHDVVFTVRSAAKGQKVMDNHSSLAQHQLNYVIVKDIAAENAFEEALKADPPFDAVIHTASPFHMNISNANELLDPAIHGTTGILQTLKQSPSIKRIVITSSFAAMFNQSRHPDKYDGSSWNPVTQDEAEQNPVDAYRASKTFAEKAAWDFIKNERPHFDLVTINPPLVIGPVVPHLNSLHDINTSNTRILNMIQGKHVNELPPSLGVYLWVDVRDVALAHVKAMETPEAGGKRFLVAADNYMCNADIASAIIRSFPELSDKFPKTIERDLPTNVYGYDNLASKNILELEYRTLHGTVTDTVKSLLVAGA